MSDEYNTDYFGIVGEPDGNFLNSSMSPEEESFQPLYSFGEGLQNLEAHMSGQGPLDFNTPKPAPIPATQQTSGLAVAQSVTKKVSYDEQELARLLNESPVILSLFSLFLSFFFFFFSSLLSF